MTSLQVNSKGAEIWFAASSVKEVSDLLVYFVMRQYELADVLSIEDMIGDLNKWKPKKWAGRTNTLRRWSTELVDALADRDQSARS